MGGLGRELLQSSNQACQGHSVWFLIISYAVWSLLLVKYKPISQNSFILGKIMKCHLCSSFRKVVEGGVNLLNVITLLVFSFRLIAGGSHFFKANGLSFQFSQKKALILYCRLEQSVQGNKCQGSQNTLKNRKAGQYCKFLKNQH